MKYRKYVPLILSALSCFGVIGTAILSAKGARKYDEKIEKDPEKPVKSFIESYYPAIMTGTATIVCIAGAGITNTSNQAALISAYGLLNESYTKYREKVIEFHGVEEHKRILNSIALDECNPPYISVTGPFSNTSINDPHISSDQPIKLFYDAYSKRYFESTLPNVMEAEYHLNRNFILADVVSLNEWYEFLGLEQTIEGNELAWFCNDGSYYWIDFTNEEQKLDDGTPYIAIYMDQEPGVEWQEEW